MRNKTSMRVIHGIVLGLLVLVTVAPFYFTIVDSFKYDIAINRNFWGFPTVFRLDNYSVAFTFLATYFLNSIVVTVGVVAGVLLSATMAAYSFARFEFPGKTFFFFFIIVLLMVPGFLLLVPQFVLIKNFGMFNTYLGQIFPPLSLGASMATLLLREFFSSIPRSVFDVAIIEGAPEWTIFASIAVPLSLPSIGIVAILNSVTAWNNYIWPLVITSGPQVAPIILVLGNIPGQIVQGLGLQLAGYVLASLPLLIMFAFATRAFINGLTSGSLKG